MTTLLKKEFPKKKNGSESEKRIEKQQNGMPLETN